MELVGHYEVAEILGISKQRFQNWIARETNNVPKPIVIQYGINKL
jgi:hypothetical protein